MGKEWSFMFFSWKEVDNVPSSWDKAKMGFFLSG